MKTFKLTDSVFQLLLFVSAFAIYLNGNHSDLFSNEYFISHYFIIGGWQLLSVLIHVINPVYNKKIMRRVYLFSLLALMVAAVISFIASNAFLMFMLVMLFVSPVMAVYYCAVCIAETRAIKNIDTKQA